MKSRGKASRGGPVRGPKKPRTPAGTKQRAQQPRKKVTPAAPARPAPEEPRTLRLGIVPGTTPGRWIDAWKERMPHVSIELVPITVATQRQSLDELDLAFVRLPLDGDTLHVIPLYNEQPVVIASTDSALLAAEELTIEDLAGEVYICPADSVYPELTLEGTTAPRFAAPETTEGAVATVASGIGFTLVPMSLARLHHRKDVEYRPFRGASESPVAVAWLRERTTEDVDAFVGIVRGRTANSSR